MARLSACSELAFAADQPQASRPLRVAEGVRRSAQWCPIFSPATKRLLKDLSAFFTSLPPRDRDADQGLPYLTADVLNGSI